MLSKNFFATTFAAAIFVTAVSSGSDYNNKKKRDNKEIQINSIELSEWQEFQEFKKLKERNSVGKTYKSYEKTCSNNSKYLQKKNFNENLTNNEEVDPPPIDKAALMARYIVNQAGWTSVGTLSSRKEIAKYPFVNLVSFSDGMLGNGSGIPYMYLTPLDFTAQDLSKDNKATLMMSLAQGNYCTKKDYDPVDPRCARVVLTGKIKPIKVSNSSEIEIAKSAVFGRHPWLAHMPKDHHFFFAKLKIQSIAVLDTFGGPKYVTIKDYLNPPSQDLLDFQNQQLSINNKTVKSEITDQSESLSVVNV